MAVDNALVLRDPAAGPVSPAPPGYTVARTPYGTLVEGPGGGRLLYARPDAPADPPPKPAPGSGGAGAEGVDGENTVPLPAAGVPAHQVDVAIVDAGESPATIGALRRAGVVGATTAVVAVGGDHRVHSPAEFERRARLWGALCPSDGQELWCPPSTWPPERVRGPHRVLVTGGARSGKSAEAERRLLGEPEVLYLATGPSPEAEDAAWARRVAEHRARRPSWWKTEETPDAAAVLRGAEGAVLFDCVGTWLAAAMDACGMWQEPAPAGAEDALAARVDDLVLAWRGCRALVVAVTNEVGSGVVPPTAAGNVFRDWLGRLNQLLAAESEQVVLATAGRVLELP
ncbi:bifunctional adenosylcobinamide kinase/adenosylcobinamide-phosphate guanylyltransferase [Streptomonospora nanhaiensis]|uniref:bifunctional adenosylcobinamide kinase/adenosylcobinamide-phosphate guanylyltransferase n=1 Tax=Streptomonospora nanhaiensis TaxID=1323731 RepID=UPI0015CCE384|nr:bifunctional adenosylcobinamide kinase/adenosylcobinamide-phosphate guanylyltransferase [Streptomonospora nanhaiensis]MBV2362370.1 bifunctional adenosylcobinamide kinase/adenosylcobinamide-phosphate guanylyltransferase [Streptomonospora nanhaiensis]MBX9390686.1 bifunctional adenosylcobinamide kinase/adenosylcobinamide-phosphate guanylyltransferase [Streptomonospora nanhaiensis]